MKSLCTNFGLALTAAGAMVFSGCGPGGTGGQTANTAAAGAPKLAGAKIEPSKSAAVERPPLASTIKAPEGKGVIVGWVNYDGEPPKPKAINFGAEKACGDLNRAHAANYETLLINPNRTVKNMLVAIRGKVPGDYPPPQKPVVLDQVGCIFTPHVLAILAGQEIEFRNSDPVSHNIRFASTRNSSFNNVFATKSSTKTKLDSPEFGIPLKCDIHYWMSGYVHVLPHPFFAITGDDGSFVISGVPPGTYTLLAWHESLKTKTESVTVGAGEVKEVDFTFAGGG
jgi:plastocyanin